MSKRSAKRKMLAVEEDVAKEIVRISELKGLTLYKFVNDILRQVIMANDMGLTLKQVVDERRVIEKAKEEGFTLVVKRLWYDAVDTAFKRSRGLTTKKWREAGKWYGKYCSSKGAEEPLKALKRVICDLMWGASDFDIEEKGNKAEVRCINSEFPLSYTELFTAFLEGAFEALGYKSKEREVSKGVIRLTLRRKRRGRGHV